MNLKDGEKLFLLLKSGDEQAFKQLYTVYSPILYNNLIKLTKDKEAAQDLLHDIFISLWDKRESIEIHTSFKTYLLITAKHMVFNLMRRKIVSEKAEKYLKHANSEYYQHIEEAIIHKETSELMDKAVDSLSTKRKEIYKLCKEENKSYAEISSILNISTSTINDHMVKANKQIKEYLTQYNNLYLILIYVFFNES
ncbi:RNA polymerase sigma factor [Sphingobacterium bovistauri]|uniref:Sigma-70 family RNA polymerase sigma factor n=1 Tax=Sphingobacterium bovistauri TaxID=2781959 RepID=A0ABS7Z1F8_9SPHI|nr:sigma-70 family RNA polymerase sigma factor [Sphingobacterium bovistauri]MCA5003995.1 sigma-70 family RNA polymerase sigma factor [Sphingobacterium bovistauri]